MSGGFFENLLGNLGLVGGGAGGLVGGAALGGAAGAGGGTLVAPGIGTIGGGGYGAWVGGAAGATAGAATGYAGGKAAGGWIDQTGPGQYVNQKVEDLKGWINGDQAADNADAKSKAITCATCAQNPCAELACGAPGSQYRGGAHGCVGAAENKIGEKGTIHSHHMPADTYSPLARPVGPSIQMLDVDHRLTSSYGSKVHGTSYAPQRAALASGQTMQAIRMDIRNARNIAAAQGDPTRYDDAIDQMMRYALCLKENGLIQ